MARGLSEKDSEVLLMEMICKKIKEAQKDEKQGIRFYKKMKKYVTDPTAKDMLDRILYEEHMHLIVLNKMKRQFQCGKR